MEVEFESPDNQVKYEIRGDVLYVTSGVFKKIDLSHPEGIEVTHPDGTVEVIKGVRVIKADTVGDIHM